MSTACSTPEASDRNDWPGPSPIVDWDWTTMNQQCNPDAKARQEQAPASVSGGGPGPKNKPKPREGFQLPTVMLPPRPPVEPPGGWASGLMKRLAEWVGARAGAVLSGIGVFVLAMLSPLDAGVSNEWEVKLSEKDEQRYHELVAKRTRLKAQGQELSDAELWELKELTNKKFPNKDHRPEVLPNKYPDEPLPKDGKVLGTAEIENGKIKPLNPQGNTFENVDFVLTEDGELILGRRHALLSSGKKIVAAGTLKVVNGKIKRISNASGHYSPSPEQTEKFPELFREIGLDTKGAYLETVYMDEKGHEQTKTKPINK